MRALFLTNEYPPHIYGGAGVHVAYLSRELAKIMEVEVRCFGDQKSTSKSLQVQGFELDTSGFTCPSPLRPVFGAIQRCVDFTTTIIEADVVHCHTWYSHFGGILAKLNYGLPLVITCHSLEPLRPWKREQLAGGYDCSLWIEKTALELADAVIAVSQETKQDILRFFNIPENRVHVIYNGIDLEEFRPVTTKSSFQQLGIDPIKPYILFVGRITRQKGVIHLVNAIQYLKPGFQIVLCAGAPDTPEIASEIRNAVTRAQQAHADVIWIEDMLDDRTKVELYSNASVFVCPSIYEPFGIINLEAMACSTAVVASAVGGIKEVVAEGETGYLVPVEPSSTGNYEVANPEEFSKNLARRINELMADPAKCQAFGRAGRTRAEKQFSWTAIAQQTKSLYQSLINPQEPQT